MDNRLEIETKIGIPLGEKGALRESVLNRFGDMGVGAKPITVSLLRSGRYSGEKINQRVDSSLAIERDDASFKTSHFAQIAQVGLDQRGYNASAQTAHILRSKYFIEDLGKVLGEDAQAVRRGIRAMRVDFVLTQQAKPDEALLGLFRNVAEAYISANNQSTPRYRSPAITFLEEAWDRRTVESFYKNLYLRGPKAIGTWTPYEIEIFSLFYRQQAETGNHLTPFDILVLKSYASGLHVSTISSMIKKSTGVSVDKKIIEQHRNTVLYGRLVYRPKPVSSA